MKLEVTRYFLRITPKNETDEAYIEEVLSLKKDENSIPLVRKKNAWGVNCIAYLTTKH